MRKSILWIALCVLLLTLYAFSAVGAVQQEHMTLTANTQWEDLEGQTLWVDLNGYDLTVGGNGTLYVFDSANDGYDADACGTVTNNGAVQVMTDVLAPNGYRYIGVTDGAVTTMHRLTMWLSTVSVRPSEAGLYYTAVYHCDPVLAQLVDSCGVVLSANNMPGADFLTETDDINRYTTISNFQSGIAVTSSVFGILDEARTADQNDQMGKVKIYANPYLRLNIGEGLILVGDTANCGKTAEDPDFTGHAYSLQDVLNMVDENYYSYEPKLRKVVDGFCDTWRDKGMATWSFTDIKRDYLRDLDLDENGVGYCPVCQKDVTWIGIDPAEYTTTSYGSIAKGSHVYLKGSVTSSTTTGSSFIAAPNYTDNVACMHLNGFDLTATKNRAIYGSAGVLNVMGTGTVAGYQNSSGAGSTIQINTSGKTGAVNLYGGTYTITQNAHASSYVLNISSNGGIINVYKTATIDGTRSDRAIHCGKSNLTNSVVGIYGATINGRIYLEEPDAAKGFEMRLTMQDATVNGTVTPGINSSENVKVTLSGKLTLSKLLLKNNLRITLEDLKPGSQIHLDAEGQFTKENTQIAAYQDYFLPVAQGYRISVKNDVLRCSMDYVSDLKLDENNQAFCPACKEIVTWTALSQAPEGGCLPNDSHSYLTNDLIAAQDSALITSPKTYGKNACLHLNGHNIKNTGNYAIFSGAGSLNVMGSGTVAGKAGSTIKAGAVCTNVTYGDFRINLYSGTYENTNTSSTYPVVGINNVGGKINIYEDVVLNRPGKQALYVGTLINKGTAILGIYGAEITGNVTIKMPIEYNESTEVGGKTSTTYLENATIHGTVTIESGTRTTVNLTGKTVIDDLKILEGDPIVIDTLAEDSAIQITASDAFAKEHEGAYQWEKYFTAADASKWVVVRNKTLTVSDRKSLPNGNKVIFFGNSRTFYGKCVIEKGQTVETQAERTGDEGYFYQLCKANGYDVDVTNFTFGGHVLKDFYSETCTTRSSHHHLRELVDRNYDYVVMQTGSVDKDLGTIVETVQSMMDVFQAENPNTKFIFLVTNNVHYGNYAWRSTIKDLEEIGVTVVDWGALVNDVVNGDATVPGGTETYHKFSFTVNATADDGYHPNVLTGYITAQMLYSAITGEKAEGQEYAFWNDPRANEDFNMATYKKARYAYDSTVPSNTNFEAIFKSPTEMLGLQQLMDRYLEEKGYRDY